MKQFGVFCIVIFVFVLVGFPSCAKRGFINGGPQDSIPPAIRLTSPANGSTNFNAKEIKIAFDEYVKLKDVNKQLIISPPLKEAPMIYPTAASKQIKITFKDTLKENTTYTLNFGQSIQDNNEGNALNQYKYVFSTGTYIDSLFLEGRISDAFEQKPDNFVSVMLYENNETFNDSTIYKERPYYVTNTLDSARTFRLENLKAGSYYLIALKDKNNNLQFDPKTEKIAFYPKPITLPDPAIYELELFREIPAFKTLRPAQMSGNQIVIGYEGSPKSVDVEISDYKEKFPIRVSKLKDKDSLQLWLPKIKADSLQIKVKKETFERTYNLPFKKIKNDTLTLSPSPSGTIHYRDTLTFSASTPIETWDTNKFKLINKDSVAVPFQISYNAWHKNLKVHFEKEENQKYQLLVLPGGITDYLGVQNDSLKLRLQTRAHTEYGNLRIKLENMPSFPIIVQLVDDKGKILAHDYTTETTELYFGLLQPNKFTVRLIFDENKNRIWDTGSYILQRQAEEVYYYPSKIDVRANWDVEQTIRYNAP